MQFIDNDSALTRACERWASAEALAIDTEFVRVNTYYPRLCLVQVSDGGEPAVIDALAVGSLEPLLERLFDTRSVKVFHAGSQDLEIFAGLRNEPVAPLFDTQLATQLLGGGEQLGYAALVEQRFGIAVDKSLTRTDWSHRPLNAAELEYAATDVTHLFRLYPILRDELAACGRLAWLEADCTRLADPARFAAPPEFAWRRLKALPRLPETAQAAAVALATWRETEARHRNRPRRWILDDDTLYALATRQPATMSQLRAIRELPAKTAKRCGTVLLDVIADAPKTGMPELYGHPPLTTEEKRRYKLLRDRLQACADGLNLPRGLLANRAELEQLTREGACADIPLTHGWRREVAAAVLTAA